VTIRPPRAVLTITAVAFICRRVFWQMIPRVSALKREWIVTISEARRRLSRPTGSTPTAANAAGEMYGS
jgi:hypothetical protein